MATQSVTELNRVQAAADATSNWLKHRVGPLETYDQPVDRLNWRLAQASALLNMINGDGLEHFQTMNESL